MSIFKSIFGGNQSSPDNEKEKQEKKNFEILKYDGIRAQRMGKLTYAIKCFEEATAIQEELETMSLLATVYTQTNRLDDARLMLERMAAFDPSQQATFLSLASVCYMQENYEGMNDACQKALALNDSHPLALYLSAKAALGLHDQSTAVAMLTRAITQRDDYTEARQLRAELLWSMGQAQEAQEDIEKLLAQNPEDEQALLLKGRALAAAGETTQAQDCFQQVIALNPFCEQAYLLQGALLLSEKEIDGAIALFDEAIDVNPRFAQAYQERGRAKLLKGDKDGSTEDMKKALELAPESEASTSGTYQNYDHLTRNIPF